MAVAQPGEAAAAGQRAGKADPEELVFFTIDQKTYALPAKHVVEVLPLAEPTPMPNWPTAALGVINVRGVLIPVIDITPMLSRPPLQLRLSTLVLVVSALERRWGLLVDGVEGVREGVVKQEHRPPEASAGSVVRGVLVEPGGAVVIALNELELLRPVLSIAQELGASEPESADARAE